MYPLKRLAGSAFFKIGIKAGLTLIAFWFIFRGIDVAHLIDIIEHQDRTLLLETSLFMVVQSVLGGVRWRMIVNALAHEASQRISVYQSQRIYYIGVFFTTCLPGTVGGDMVRIWMTRDIGHPLAQAINSVIIDRMIALIGIGIMVLITLPVIAGLIGVDIAVIYPGAAAVTVAGLVLLWNMERILKPFSHVKPVHWVLHFMRSLKLIVSHPGICLGSICLAVIAHMSYSLSAFTMAESLGIPMTVMQSMTFMPLIMLVTTIPISIGGWGLREASMIGLLGMVGVKPEAAVVLSVQMGLLFMLISMPASIMWLLNRRHAKAHPQQFQHE